MTILRTILTVIVAGVVACALFIGGLTGYSLLRVSAYLDPDPPYILPANTPDRATYDFTLQLTLTVRGQRVTVSGRQQLAVPVSKRDNGLGNVPYPEGSGAPVVVHIGQRSFGSDMTFGRDTALFRECVKGAFRDFAELVEVLDNVPPCAFSRPSLIFKDIGPPNPSEDMPSESQIFSGAELLLLPVGAELPVVSSGEGAAQASFVRRD